MRKTFFSSITACPIHLACLMLVLSSLLGGRVAQASSGRLWNYNPQDSVLKLQLLSGIEPKYFLLPNPLRLVVDFPQTSLDSAPIEQQVEGNVSRIRVSEFQPGMTRVVMELAPNSVLQDQQVALEELGGGQWQIRPLLETPQTMVQTAQAQTLEITGGQEGDNHSMAIELPVVAAGNSPEPEIGLDSGISLPTPAIEAPAAARFSNAVHSFQPLPKEEDRLERTVKPAENLAVDPFIEALPSVPTQGSQARQSDPFIIETAPFQSTRFDSNRSEISEEPRVPFMVEFGEPLPGMSTDFPAAYMSREEESGNR